MAKTARTADGEELKLVLLRSVESDEQGPRILEMMRDHEKYDVNENFRVFTAWVKVNNMLGEMHINDLFSDFDKIKAQAKELHEMRIEQDRAIKTAQKQLADQEEEIKLKTEALRELQKERDPERFQKAVNQAVDFQLGQFNARLKE